MEAEVTLEVRIGPVVSSSGLLLLLEPFDDVAEDGGG